MILHIAKYFETKKLQALRLSDLMQQLSKE